MDGGGLELGKVEHGMTVTYDPNKDGNFKPDWKWGGHKGKFVRSPISPKNIGKEKSTLPLRIKI